MKQACVALVVAIVTGAGALAQDLAAGPIWCDKEAECLRRLKGIARRNGDMLQVKLETGKAKVFRGNRGACDKNPPDNCLTHDLRAYLPALNLFLVDVGYWEGGGAEAVSTKTGRSVVLDTLPEFSPNGRWFVSVSNTELGERAYDVGIWSTAPDVPKQELRYRTPDGEPYEYWEFQGWDGDDRILLSVSINPGDGAMRNFETDAIRTEQGWKLNRPKL